MARGAKDSRLASLCSCRLSLQRIAMPKILFVAAHRPDRSPSQRYRFEQFAPYWEQHGFTHHYAWLIDAEDDKKFYAPGNIVAKARIFLKSLAAKKEARAHGARTSI